MGKVNLFGVRVGSFYWNFYYEDRVAEVSPDCLTSDQQKAEAIAREKDGKVVIFLLESTTTYTV
jgi:hypothetical protein